VTPAPSEPATKTTCLILRAGDTVASARRAVAQAFAAARLDTPELDARVLLGHALGLDHAGIAAGSDRRLAAAELEQLERIAARRLRREPVARIVGVKEFWGLPIRLSPATLVPRPETETVVETALAALEAEGRRAHPLRLADLGTGSGAILCALLTELPAAFAVGTDINPSALATARENARALGVERRAAFIVGDLGAAIASGLDLLVCNPPYVRRAEIESLAPEVRDYEPRRALDGGDDGLSAYRALAGDAARLLGARSHLVLEIGAGQASAVTALFRAQGFDSVDRHPDLAGIDRALHIRRK
jgi:release factor glutamine methyltransferase